MNGKPWILYLVHNNQTRRNRKTKQCEWGGCDRWIRPVSTYCVQHAQLARHIEHNEQIVDNIHPRHLRPIPDGLELIYYPYMARSTRGEAQVREQVRRRLVRYFRRKGKRQ